MCLDPTDLNRAIKRPIYPLPKYYDRSSKPLQILKTGDVVRFKPVNSKKWSLAQVVRIDIGKILQNQDRIRSGTQKKQTRPHIN